MNNLELLYWLEERGIIALQASKEMLVKELENVPEKFFPLEEEKKEVKKFLKKELIEYFRKYLNKEDRGDSSIYEKMEEIYFEKTKKSYFPDLYFDENEEDAFIKQCFSETGESINDYFIEDVPIYEMFNMPLSEWCINTKEIELNIKLKVNKKLEKENITIKKNGRNEFVISQTQEEFEKLLLESKIIK